MIRKTALLLLALMAVMISCGRMGLYKDIKHSEQQISENGSGESSPRVKSMRVLNEHNCLLHEYLYEEANKAEKHPISSSSYEYPEGSKDCQAKGKVVNKAVDNFNLEETYKRDQPDQEWSLVSTLHSSTEYSEAVHKGDFIEQTFTDRHGTDKNTLSIKLKYVLTYYADDLRLQSLITFTSDGEGGFKELDNLTHEYDSNKRQIKTTKQGYGKDSVTTYDYEKNLSTTTETKKLGNSTETTLKKENFVLAPTSSVAIIDGKLVIKSVESPESVSDYDNLESKDEYDLTSGSETTTAVGGVTQKKITCESHFWKRPDEPSHEDKICKTYSQDNKLTFTTTSHSTERDRPVSGYEDGDYTRETTSEDHVTGQKLTVKETKTCDEIQNKKGRCEARLFYQFNTKDSVEVGKTIIEFEFY